MQPVKEVSLKKFIPAIIWIIVVLVLVMMPGKQLPESEFLFEIN